MHIPSLKATLFLQHSFTLTVQARPMLLNQIRTIGGTLSMLSDLMSHCLLSALIRLMMVTLRGGSRILPFRIRLTIMSLLERVLRCER